MRLQIETTSEGVHVTDPDTGEVIDGVLGVDIDLTEGRVALVLALASLDLTVGQRKAEEPRALGFKAQ